MEKINIVLFLMSAGFTFIIVFLLHMENIIVFRIVSRIETLNKKMTDIDQRLSRLENAFNEKECCKIQEERHLKQKK